MTNPNDFEGALTISKIDNLHFKKSLLSYWLSHIMHQLHQLLNASLFLKATVEERKKKKQERSSMCEVLFNEHPALQTDFSRDINSWLWQAISGLVAFISGIRHKWEIPVSSKKNRGWGRAWGTRLWGPVKQQPGLQTGISDYSFSGSGAWVPSPSFFLLRRLVWRHVCSLYLGWLLKFHQSGQKVQELKEVSTHSV